MYNFQGYFPRNYQLTAYSSFLFHVFIPNRYLARINFVIFIFAFTSTALGASFADFETLPFAPDKHRPSAAKKTGFTSVPSYAKW